MTLCRIRPVGGKARFLPLGRSDRGRLGYAQENLATFQMITAQWIAQGHLRMVDVSRAFGVPALSVKRALQWYREASSGERRHLVRPASRSLLADRDAGPPSENAGLQGSQRDSRFDCHAPAYRPCAASGEAAPGCEKPRPALHPAPGRLSSNATPALPYGRTPGARLADPRFRNRFNPRLKSRTRPPPAPPTDPFSCAKE
jgi:hypothetical protein